MYYFKATVKTLKITANNQYLATFSYCETFKGLDKKTYGIAYDNNNPIKTTKLDEDQDFTTGTEIFNFLCSMKNEKLLIGFETKSDETKSDDTKIQIKEVSLKND